MSRRYQALLLVVLVFAGCELFSERQSIYNSIFTSLVVRRFQSSTAVSTVVHQRNHAYDYGEPIPSLSILPTKDPNESVLAVEKPLDSHNGQKATTIPDHAVSQAERKVRENESSSMIRINVGGIGTSVNGVTWERDMFYVGGQNEALFHANISIDHVGVYSTQRYGIFDYEVPISPGNYLIQLHFMALKTNSTIQENVFDVFVEGELAFQNVDIIGLAGAPFKPLILELPVVCLDGHLSMHFRAIQGRPSLSALQVQSVGDHLAHAVAGGPYDGVDVDDDGVAHILVDASASHTHGIGRSLISWEWFEGTALIGYGETTTVTCSVGVHDVVLKVIDDGGNQHSEKTTITVKPAGHPLISTLDPPHGYVFGGNSLTIVGHGFKYNESETKVTVGASVLSGSHDFSILNDTTIAIRSMPPSELGVPVPISVATPAGSSNTVNYVYVDRYEIEWDRGVRSYLRPIHRITHWSVDFAASIRIPSAYLPGFRARRKVVRWYNGWQTAEVDTERRARQGGRRCCFSRSREFRSDLP